MGLRDAKDIKDTLPGRWGDCRYRDHERSLSQARPSPNNSSPCSWKPVALSLTRWLGSDCVSIWVGEGWLG